MILADDEATRRAGALLETIVRGGDVIALVGDLGAGKTTFVGGFVHARGGEATSPTFSLVHEYAGVWHADLYRVEREAELPELGLDDVLGRADAVCFVEWADRFPQLLPRDHLQIQLVHDGGARRLEAIGTGPRGRELAAELLRLLECAPPPSSP